MNRFLFSTLVGLLSVQTSVAGYIECYANDSSGSGTHWISGRCTLHESEYQNLFDQILECAAGNASRACRARNYGTGFPCDVESSQCQVVR